MEEKTKREEPKKLSYDELSKAASEIHAQYQKLVTEYQKVIKALNDKEFEMNAFFLNALFRVMDHPEMYNDEFTKWASDNIEAALKSFAETASQEAGKEEKKDNEGK